MVKQTALLSVIPTLHAIGRKRWRTIHRRRSGLWLVALFLALVGCGNAAGSADNGMVEGVIYQDDFSPGETGPWFLEGDDVGRALVDGGQLVIAIDQPNTIQYATLAEMAFSDFVLEVDVRQVSGSPESSFGLLARMPDPAQFYRFEITGDGLFMVERRNADGGWTRYLADWTPSPAINQGLNVPNRLKVVARGANLAFYANDILLHEVGDALFTTGAIALDAGTFGAGGLQVAFDNLVVSELR
jgi:hypothetical protein